MQNAFIGKLDRPTETELAENLGPAKVIWDRLIRKLGSEFETTEQEWSSYSTKAGWSLRMKRQGRIIVYLSPGRAVFLASFALGEKALKMARESALPARVLKIVSGAKRYAEGTAVRIEVRREEDIGVIEKLAAAKIQN